MWKLEICRAAAGDKCMFAWRAIDDEGEVLDMPDQRRRDTEAALKLLKRFCKNSHSTRTR